MKEVDGLKQALSELRPHHTGGQQIYFVADVVFSGDKIQRLESDRVVHDAWLRC
jgi:hypothetical protein